MTDEDAVTPPNTVQGSVQAVHHLDARQLIQHMSIRPTADLIRHLEALRGTRVVSLVYHERAQPPAMLAPALFGPLEDVLRGVGQTQKLDLFLRTTGGITEVPWRIISLLREFCEELGVIVSGMAFSGGTHIAIAADELVMTAFSAIGSVDPTRRHPLLPQDAHGNPIPTSVQDLKHCVEFIREQLGANNDSQSLSRILTELFHYVNPLAIGALEQSYSLSRLITRKALLSRRQPLSNEVVDLVTETLAGRYFSHNFLISRRDVESDLGLPVTRPDEPTTAAIEALQSHYEMEFARRLDVGGSGQPSQFAVGAFLETTADRWVIGQLTSGGQLQADPWIKL